MHLSVCTHSQPDHSTAVQRQRQNSVGFLGRKGLSRFDRRCTTRTYLGLSREPHPWFFLMKLMTICHGPEDDYGLERGVLRMRFSRSLAFSVDFDRTPCTCQSATGHPPTTTNLGLTTVKAWKTWEKQRCPLLPINRNLLQTVQRLGCPSGPVDNTTETPSE